MSPHTFPRWAAFAALSFSLIVSGAHAQPPGTTAAGVIDLAPGPDAFSPQQLAVNPVTNRLYVTGGPASTDQNPAIKVIDTATKQIIGGVDLGRYGNPTSSFMPIGMAVDWSGGPAGNKVYVLGRMDGKSVLRVIDGETNQNLTGEGSDLVLPPITFQQHFSAPSWIVVNPNNHKVYIADGFGEVIVVDGPSRQIITTLNPDAGSFLALSPTSNKVFVMGHNVGGDGKRGVVIDSTTDTFKQISTAMPNVAGAAFNPINNRVYFSGRVGLRYGLYVLDGSTGEMLMEGNIPNWHSLAISPSRNALFTGGDEYAADTLTFRRRLFDMAPASNTGAGAVTDVEGGDDLFFPHESTASRNAVAAIDLATLQRTQITVGYRPLGMVANSRTDRLYVTDGAAAELVVLQASSGNVTARVPLGPVGTPPSDPFATQPRSVAVSERLNRVYVAPHGSYAEAPAVNVLDGTTNQVRSSIAVPAARPDSPIAVDDSRRRIYIGLIEPASAPFVRYPYGRPKVAVYDADSETLVDTLYLSDATGWPSVPNIAVNPILGRLYVLHSGTITTIDTVTNVVVARHGLPLASSIAVHKRTGKVFVSFMRSSAGSPNASDTRIAVLNGLTGALETEFAPPEGDYFGVRALAVDEISDRLYASQAIPAPNDNESRRHRITAYDGDTYELLGEHTSLDARNMVFDPGSRRLFVAGTNYGTIDIFQSTTAAEADLLGNISTRGYVGAGDNALIGGFIINGAPGATKRVAVRALGPSLGEAGVAGVVSDTTLELHDAAGNILHNDDWKVDPETNASQEAEVLASGLAPGSDGESMLIAALPPGPCTAVVRGKDGAAGVALVEVYDLDRAAGSKMSNIATRGIVGTGENVMIGGFIVVGSNPSRVLVRAIGPSLTTVEDALQDPVLELRDLHGGLVDVSDDWKTGRESEITDTTIPPTDERESAIVATLPPGNYTAIVRGKDETTGVALVEAYHLP